LSSFDGQLFASINFGASSGSLKEKLHVRRQLLLQLELLLLHLCCLFCHFESVRLLKSFVLCEHGASEAFSLKFIAIGFSNCFEALYS